MVDGIEIRRSSRRSIAIVISPDGDVFVKAPVFSSDSDILRFVRSKQDWINRNVGKISKRKASQELPRIKHTFQAGDSFYYLGREFPLIIDPQQKRQLLFQEAFRFSITDKKTIQRKLLNWYKKQAEDIFNVRILVWEQAIGVGHKKIRLSSAKTRWGSCSSTGTISLNWKLMMAPLDIIDYVIVHELVHVIHPNHSKSFWNEVARHCPDFKAKRKWLKDNGEGLSFN